jgi:hypothetical protein
MQQLGLIYRRHNRDRRGKKVTASVVASTQIRYTSWNHQNRRYIRKKRRNIHRRRSDSIEAKCKRSPEGGPGTGRPAVKNRETSKGALHWKSIHQGRYHQDRHQTQAAAMDSMLDEFYGGRSSFSPMGE